MPPGEVPVGIRRGRELQRRRGVAVGRGEEEIAAPLVPIVAAANAERVTGDDAATGHQLWSTVVDRQEDDGGGQRGEGDRAHVPR